LHCGRNDLVFGKRRDCGGGRIILATPAWDDMLGAAFFNWRRAMRIIAGGLFVIAGAIMVSTSAVLAQIYGHANVELENVGGVTIIAGGLLTLIGRKDFNPAHERRSMRSRD
jgi:hypothetical protein